MLLFIFGKNIVTCLWTLKSAGKEGHQRFSPSGFLVTGSCLTSVGNLSRDCMCNTFCSIEIILREKRQVFWGLFLKAFCNWLLPLSASLRKGNLQEQRGLLTFKPSWGELEWYISSHMKMLGTQMCLGKVKACQVRHSKCRPSRAIMFFEERSGECLHVSKATYFFPALLFKLLNYSDTS